MTSPTVVSVVIPTRDRRDLLLTTLRSVRQQTHRDLDVVVVDEASSDDTVSAVEALGDARVRVVRHAEARGVAAARNSGIAAATGELVAFVDDDDLWAPTKIAEQVSALARHPAATWSCTSAVRVYEPSLRLGAAERLRDPSSVLRQLLESNVVPGGGSGVLARLSTVRELGGFDVDFHHSADWEMWIRLATTGPVAAVDRPLVAYYVRAGGMAHDLSRGREGLQQVAVKHRALADGLSTGVDRTAADHYHASNLLRAGRRWEALGIYRALARRHELQPLAGAIAAVSVVVPATRRLVDVAARVRLPAGWYSEVRTWLEPLR